MKANTEQRWVGFDLDEVVAVLRDPMATGLSKIRGHQLDWREWKHYDFFDKYTTRERFLEMIVEERILETCDIEPDAAEAIERLQREGVQVGIFTARGYHPEAKKVTEDWLSGKGVRVDLVEIIGLGQSKFEAIARVPGLTNYIDDHLDHLHGLEAISNRVNRYVMDRPWNTHDTSFQRIHSVSEYADSVLRSYDNEASFARKIKP